MTSKSNPLTTKLAITLLGLGAISVTSHAAIIAYDSFSGYTNGSLVGQGQGTGWGSNNWNGQTNASGAVVSTTGNLTYSGVTSTGGGASSGTNSASDNGWLLRDLGTPITTTGTYFFGFLLQQTGNPDKAGFRIQDGSGNQYAGAGAWDTSKGQTDWQLYRRDGGDYNTESAGVADTTDLTYFVMKLDFVSGGTTTASLYIDPADADALSGTANETHTFVSQWTNISRVQASLNGASGNTGTMKYDEILIADSADDMFAPIPEPSALGLVGLGGMALLLRRRRA